MGKGNVKKRERGEMYSVRQVIKPSDLVAAYRLRYQIFCLEKKWLDPSNYPDGQEIDGYDAYSTHFLILNDKEEPVGTVRAIRCSERGFPMERVFKLPEWISRIQFAEVSRPCIVQSERKNSLPLLIGLFRGMWNYGYNQAITYWGAVMDKPFYRLMKSLGLHFVIEGSPVFYLGSESVPVVAEMEETITNLYSKRVEKLLQEKPGVRVYV